MNTVPNLIFCNTLICQFEYYADLVFCINFFFKGRIIFRRVTFRELLFKVNLVVPLNSFKQEKLKKTKTTKKKNSLIVFHSDNGKCNMDDNKIYASHGLPWWHSGKKSTCQCCRQGFDPWVRKIPWRKKWQTSLVFLPGNSHGERSLEGCSPWGLKRWTRFSD